MSGAGAVTGNKQNRHLNRDRFLVPFHGPSGTIPDDNPITINIMVPGAETPRDLMLEVTGDLPLQLSFDGGVNFKTLKSGAVFAAYCNFRQLVLQGAGAQYEILYNAEGAITFGSLSANFNALTVAPVQDPVVYNVLTSGTPGVETSFEVPTIKRFAMTNRGDRIVQVSYAEGESGTNYVSVFPGSAYIEEGINSQTITFYIQSPSANQRLEVVTWS